MRPLVGVTGGRRRWNDAPRTGITSLYPEAVVAAGGVPLVLTPIADAGDAAALVAAVHALVLTGGEDVDPAAYGAAPSPHLQETDPRRDAFELALVRHALARELPVLAICRGIQVLNVALGGTLWQDLAHERPGSASHDEWHDRARRVHGVRIRAGSRLHAALGVTTLEVNSIHHQAVRDVGAGLVVTAEADDGVIEGVELPGAAWVAGVQWHPEELAEASRADAGLFAALVDAASARRAAA